MRIAVVSLFPEMFSAISDYGVTGRAVEQGRLELLLSNPRDYATDRHGTVDDRPYGGGPGMLMKVATLEAAIGAARAALGESAEGAESAESAESDDDAHSPDNHGARSRVIYLSPQGRRFDHRVARELAGESRLILVAGRYEGIDERLLDSEIDEELSIGDFVLSGGELAAMVVIDAVSRQLPGVLGHAQSAEQDSFENGLLDCPHYTRPEEYRGQSVPEVLLSGNHELIRRWRLKQSLARTLERRPELLDQRALTPEEEELLTELESEGLVTRSGATGKVD